MRGRLGRGVPGREPGPDGHPAPAQAAGVLRPGGGGGPDPAGPDPGRLGPPLHPPPQRRRAGHLPAPAAGAVPGQDPRGAAVPGAAHADGRGRRRVHAPPRPTSSARPWGPSAPASAWSASGAACTRAWPSGGSTGRGRRPDLREAGRLRQLRLPREPLGVVRLPGLRQRLAEAPLPGRVPGRPAERPADGLLVAQHPGRRRPPPRRGRPRPRRQPLRGHRDAGGER